MVKVAVIGGGSSYTPELLEGLLERRSSLNLDRICLMDIDSQRLQILSSLGERMAAKTGADIRIESTTQPDQAIDGADYVITQFRVGGMAARIRDEKLGLRNHIIGQETTGIGGFAKALRTIPAILNIAAIIEKRAPQAWLVNFTNPAGIITESVLKHSSVRVVGLCNIPIGYIMAAAKAFSVSPSSIELDYAGLNHLSWVRGCRVDGIDRFPEFLEIIAGEFEEEEKPSSRAMAMWTRFLGVVPNYYFAYYFCTALVLEELKARTRTRGEEVVEVETTLFQKYADPALSEKPSELEKRGGAFYSTAAVNLIESLATNRGDIQVVNVRNNSILSELPPECAVEIPCRITGSGPVPLPQSPLPPELRGMLQVVKAYEELTVRAGALGDRKSAILALATHPLVRQVSEVSRLFEEILEENCQFLLQFARS